MLAVTVFALATRSNSLRSAKIARQEMQQGCCGAIRNTHGSVATFVHKSGCRTSYESFFSVLPLLVMDPPVLSASARTVLIARDRNGTAEGHGKTDRLNELLTAVLDKLLEVWVMLMACMLTRTGCAQHS